MDKIKPDRIEALRIPRHVLEGTWRYLRDRGTRQLEGVVYWTGEATTVAAVVKHFLVPAAYERESAVHLSVGRDAVFELIRKIHELDEFLLARVHSHAQDAFHSLSDDEGCLSGRVGFLSVVVPNFARGPVSLNLWAAYERTSDGGWRPLDHVEVKRRFLIG